MARRGTRVPEPIKQQIKTLLNQGLNYKEIGLIVNKNRATVAKAAEEMGVAVKKRISVTDEMREQIRELCIIGTPDDEAAKWVGVAESTYRIIRVELGFRRRPAAESNNGGIPADEPYCNALTGLRREVITGAWV